MALDKNIFFGYVWVTYDFVTNILWYSFHVAGLSYIAEGKNQPNYVNFIKF